CSGPGLDMNRDARTAGKWATAAFAVGATGLVAATVLWITAAPRTNNVQVGLAGGSLRVRGTW
ncbi:MAG TPA: hypothetical protein VFQ61_21545, partial [Polyangiaceae bacterium]|nr:hypothetical protein [Polyangiaceae bacterium]